MKLNAYVYGSNNITLLTQYEIAGNAPFVASDTTPAGYEDVTSIVNWGKYWNRSGKDYDVARSEIKKLCEATTWTSLNADEKKVVSEFFLVDQAKRAEVFTSGEDMLNAIDFAGKSRQARISRYRAATIMILHQLQVEDAKQVAGVMGSNSVLFNYLELGIVGLSEGDPEGIIDYLDETVGSSFENNGFKSFAFTLRDYPDMSTFAAVILAIIKDGNY